MANNNNNNIQKLWKAYKQNNDAQAREQLILHFLPMVKSVVGRLAARFPSHMSKDDLESSGLLGLMDAVAKFDPESGVDFSTYGALRIKGAIIDELRALDWAPRSIRKREREVDEAYAQLEQMLGRRPSEKEVAEFLGISLSKLQTLLTEIGRLTHLSLEELIGDDMNEDSVNLLPLSGTLPFPNPLEALVTQEARVHLANTIETLSKQERLVVTLYYYEELTLKEVGKVLGVSESRVSQIHSSAILHLRTKLHEVSS